MTGQPVGALNSRARVQSGLADAASASCPGGGHSFHACSHTHTLKEHTNRKHKDQNRFSNDAFNIKIATYETKSSVVTGGHHRAETGGALLWNLDAGQLSRAVENLGLSLESTFIYKHTVDINRVAVSSGKHNRAPVCSPCCLVWGPSFCGAAGPVVCFQAPFHFGQPLPQL